MGKGPEKSDYQPSEADRTNAAISVKRYNDFKTKYAPMLVEMRDKANRTGLIKVARGRANADVMQALTGSTPPPQATTDPSLIGEPGRALQSQLEKATAKGMEARNNMGAGVLAAANQQALTAQDGLAQVARLDTSSTLAEAARKQSEKNAKWDLATKLGGAVIASGGANLASGGSFFTPNAADSLDAKGNIMKGVAPKSLKERLSIGMGRIT